MHMSTHQQNRNIQDLTVGIPYQKTPYILIKSKEGNTDIFSDLSLLTTPDAVYLASHFHIT